MGGRRIFLIIILIQLILSQIFLINGSHLPENSNSSLLTEQETNLILDQFDNVISDLNTFQMEPTTLKINSVRGRTKCTISKEKLENLKKEIEDALTNVSNKNPSTCTLDFNGSNNCDELTKVILCGVKHLKAGFTEASKTGSIQEITKWKNAYETLLNKYEKELENLKQSLSQEFQLQLDKLKTELQNLGKRLNEALERLETITFDLCVLAIRNGEIDKAVDQIPYLNFNLISQFIKEVYYSKIADKELKSYGYVMNFIKKQSKIKTKLLYEILHKEMLENKVLGSFFSIDASLKFAVQLCALEIILGKIDESVQIFQSYLQADSAHNIILEAFNYHNIEDEKVNFENIMKFIIKQEKIKDKKILYNTLYDNMLKYYKSNVLESTKINLCVLAIARGNIDEADRHLKDLETISISEIVKRSITYDKQNLEKFILKQSDICNKIIGFTSRFKEFNHSYVELWPDFDQDMFNFIISNKHKCLNVIQEFFSEFFVYKYYAVDFDVNSHFEDIFKPALQIAFQKKEILTKKNFIHYVLKNFNQDLKQKFTIFSILFEELKKHDLINNNYPITFFAYYLKNFLERTDYNTLDDKSKEMIQYIRQQLPLLVRNLIWNGDKCKLKNAYLNEYLYAHDQYGSSGKRRIFTQISQSIIEAKSQWKFEFDDDVGFFMIKNVHWNEWLFYSRNTFGFNEVRPVYTFVGSSGWIIELTNNDNFIKIRHDGIGSSSYGQYLYVDSTDKWNKLGYKVYVGYEENPSDVRLIERKWELIC